jgi:hypothetical protein
MTLLSVVREVCAAVGVAIPQSVFTNITGNRTMAEMLALANEMAQRIAFDTRDWTKLRKVQTFTGDGIQTAFDIPQNYRRMLLTANVWRSTSSIQPMVFVPDTDEWLNRRARGDYSAWGEWTMLGGQMHIHPVMPVGVTAYFAYLDKNSVALNAGGFGEVFQDDLDTWPIGERVLKLGMIWQWKANKGGAYAEDMGTFGDAIAKLQGADSPAPIIAGYKTISSSVRVAYPYPLPTP